MNSSSGVFDDASTSSDDAVDGWLCCIKTAASPAKADSDRGAGQMHLGVHCADKGQSSEEAKSRRGFNTAAGSDF